MVDIYQYTNYRIFLKACYDDLKENHNAFSYRYFSQKCGYKSPNFLKLVIDGKRNLSPESTKKFAVFFKLGIKETKYFELLVDFNQAKVPEEKRVFAKKIMRSSTFKRLHPMGKDHFEYYSHWYNVGIREVLATKRIKLDAKEISKILTPKISEKEVEDSLALLLRLNLIKRRDNRYVQTNELITTGDEVSSLAVADYHKNMLNLAARSIDEFQREVRDISAVTVSISDENIAELKTLIQRFRKNILDLSEQDQKKKHVYQVGIQMFPLTRVEEDS